MAVKNLQTVALWLANQHGVRVTGMECKESMRLGSIQAPLSLPRLPRPGYPGPKGPDADLQADNAAAAQAVTRVGRSVRGSARFAGHLSKRWSPKNLVRG